MANGQNQYNPMQANMGLFPQAPTPTMLMTPSPADTSLRLMEQAQQRTAFSHQVLQGSSLTAIQSFGNQFQQRFQQAQSLQSMSPYQAQAMSGMMPQQVQGGGPSYLPSPLTMTPAQTGVFRPPLPSPTMPIPPMYTPPIIPMPFQPQMPRPMFQQPWEQAHTAGEMQSQRMFSYGIQAPQLAGQALGIGAGALMGSRLGGAFGPMGRVAGAIGGGILAGRTGISEAMGNIAQYPFQPMIETRQMGAALQRMSQDFVVSGPQLSAIGRGISRTGGIDLAGEIKGLSQDQGFKAQTGEMFNRQDLMRMTQLSGQAGLMDMSQSVPQIKDQLRQVAVTVRKFMELTNDPDVTSVVRQMGQLHQFGMTVPQINQAAENMRLFSRAAGTSVRGLRDMGGMPGAAVFQGMGLSAAQGFDYGNFSMMMARQAVAGGGISPRQLAMQGGVQGMAQRNMQAQAAFMSMPLFAAANAQLGGNGMWGAVDSPQNMGGGQGAFGMVNQAVQNLNGAVRRGGVGALTTFQMQQQELADEAASRMTPMEQTAQRFRMAMQTGRMLRGASSQDQFNFGAQMLYGREVAGQMSMEMRDPNMWVSQERMFRGRASQLAAEERQRTVDAAPGFFGHLGEVTGVTGAVSRFGRDIKRGVTRPFEEIGDWASDTASRVGDYFGTPEGVSRFRARKGTGMTSSQASAIGRDRGLGRSYSVGETSGFFGEINRLSEYQRALAHSGATGAATGNWIAGGATTMTSLGPVGLTENAALAFGGVINQGLYSEDEQDKLIRQMHSDEMRGASLVERGKKKVGDIKDITAGSDALSKSLGIDGYAVMNRASVNIANKAKDYIFSPNEMSGKDYDKAMIDAIVEISSEAGKPISRKEAAAKYAAMPKAGKETALSQAINKAKQGDATVKEVLDVSSAGEQRKRYFERVDAATETIQELQEDEQERLENQVFGAAWYLEGKEPGEETRELIKGLTQRETILTAAAAAEKGEFKDKTAYSRAKEQYLKMGGEEKDWIKDWEGAQRKLENLSPEQLEDLGRAGTKDLNRVAEWSRNIKDQGVSRALRSQAFAGEFEAFGGDKFREAMAGERGQITNISEFVSAMSPEALEQMGKTGTQKQKALAKLAQRAKEGDEKAQSKLMEYASRVGGEEVEDRQQVAPEGEAAKAAEQSADAAGEMALVAQQFGPAVADFAKAAKNLLDASEIQRANASQGRGD